MSQQFVKELTATGNVQVEKLGREEAMDRVRRGKLVGMIAIPKGFGETAGMMWMEGPAIEVGIDPSRKAEAGMLEGMIMQATGKLMVARFQDPASMRPFIKQAQAGNRRRRRHADPDAAGARANDGFARRLHGVVGDSAQAAADETMAASRPRDMPEFQLANIETIDVTRKVPKGQHGSARSQGAIEVGHQLSAGDACGACWPARPGLRLRSCASGSKERFCGCRWRR